MSRDCGGRGWWALGSHRIRVRRERPVLVVGGVLMCWTDRSMHACTLSGFGRLDHTHTLTQRESDTHTRTQTLINALLLRTWGRRRAEERVLQSQPRL